MEPRDHGVELEADVRPRRRLTSAAEIGGRETQNRECRRHRGKPRDVAQSYPQLNVKLQSDTLLAGIRFVSIELEVGREPAAEGAKTPQQLVTPGLSRNAELPGVSDMDFDLIAFPELERLDDCGGKADSETVSPFGDLHAGFLFGYTFG